jgi:signal transduction histidine kinase
MRRLDLLLGLALTALGLTMALGEGTWLAVATMPAVTLPVIWRERAPLAAAAAVAAGVVVSGIPTFAQVRCGVAIPAALLVLYALAVRREGRAAAAGLGLVLSGMVFLVFTDPQISTAALAFVVPLCCGVWACGLVVRSRMRLAAALADRTRELAERREETARLAVELDRLRLAGALDAAARDRLHAIVELSATADAEDARAAFAEIEQAGRASLDDMRGLLGSLRA